MSAQTAVLQTAILPSTAAPRRALQAVRLAMPPALDAAGICDTGTARQDNQDAFRLETDAIGTGREVLAAVADGMGGLSQGRFASQLALDIFFEAFRRQRNAISAKALRIAMEEANQAILQAGQRLRLAQMGTTFTAACLEGRWLTLAHIGDSRAYLIRDGAVRQLTADHSMAADLARLRLIPADSVRAHEQRAVLTRALGMQLLIQPDIRQVDVRRGDLVLLCTDGVWSAFAEADLGRMADPSGGPAEFARRTVERAMESGSEDNVCAVALRIGDRPFESRPAGGAGLWDFFRRPTR